MKVRLFAGPQAQAASGLSEFRCSEGATDYAQSTTSAAHIKIYTAHTFTDLGAWCSSWTDENNPTVDQTINALGGTLSLTVTGTGWWEDTTNSDTVSANDTVYINQDGNGMHGDEFTIDGTCVSMENASNDAPVYCSWDDNAASSATRSFPLTAANNEIASTARMRFPESTTLSNLNIFVSRYASGVGTAFYEVQPGTSNLQIVVTGTGRLEDTTGNETMATSDNARFYAEPENTGRLGCSICAVDSDVSSMIRTDGGHINSIGTTRAYGWFFSHAWSTTANDVYKARIGAATMAHLFTSCTSASGDVTLAARINTTNSTALELSIAATGDYTDSTGSESVADADTVGFTAIDGTGTSELRFPQVGFPYDPPTGSLPPVHRPLQFRRRTF